MALRHVIVGAGPAGQSALETLRALDPQAKLTLVCDEPAYARMVLPYYLSGRIEERAVHTGDARWFGRLGVETRFGARVRGIDPDGHRIALDDGSHLEYDRLLVATGSRVAEPAIPGCDAAGVIPMWTLEHARRFLARGRGETTIVGAGFIAFTVLDAVAHRSARVRFLEIAPQILPRMLDAPAAALLHEHLESRGIGIRTGVTVDRIESGGSTDGRIDLVLADGQHVACDSAILATGVRANLELLEGSGIECDHGILVDAHMRTSAADVYAAGDVAQGPDLLGGPRRVQAIQPTAVDHGRVAAANMAGHEVAYSGSLTMNVLAAQGLEACSFGRWDDDRDALRVENPASRIYRKYCFEGDVLVGGVLVGPTLAVTGVNDVGMLKGLIQTGRPLGRWKAYLEENPLDLRRPYLASGAAGELLRTTLLAGRATGGGGFRFPSLAARRARSAHHGVLAGGSPGSVGA